MKWIFPLWPDTLRDIVTRSDSGYGLKKRKWTSPKKTQRLWASTMGLSRHCATSQDRIDANSKWHNVLNVFGGKKYCDLCCAFAFSPIFSKTRERARSERARCSWASNFFPNISKINRNLCFECFCTAPNNHIQEIHGYFILLWYKLIQHIWN